jgi:two-component system response regulator YesN
VWLIQPKTPAPPPAEGAVSAETYLKENAALVQDAAASSLSLALSLAVDVGSPWEELSDRIDSLKMLLNYRIGRESGRLLIDKSAVAGIGGRTAFGPLLANRSRSERQNGRPTPTLPGSAAARRAVERLAEYLENGDREEFFACLDEAAPREAGDLHDLESVERYYAIALVLLSYLNRWSVAEKAAPLVSLHKLMNADAHSSWDEAVAYLRRLGNVFFDIQDADTERRAADSVGLVQTHILEHVREADELTLARLADLAHLNPSYLSRLFKQVAGLNLSEYIARMRVAEAKRLLTDPAVKIHEVAETLGYGTATNFTRFFKKFTNLTPQEYRERSLRSADAGRPEVKS